MVQEEEMGEMKSMGINNKIRTDPPGPPVSSLYSNK